MITRVRVKNFRSIADIDVTLGPLTVLVGRNGAGKSTFVDVLRFVRDAFQYSLDTAIMERHGIGSLKRWAFGKRSTDIEISLTVLVPNLFWGEYSFAIGSEHRDGYRIKKESLWFGDNEAQASKKFEIGDGKWKTFPQSPFPGKTENDLRPLDLYTLWLPWNHFFDSSNSNFLRMYLSDIRVYSLFPNLLREPQKPSYSTFLSEHGENLASVLKDLKRRWSGHFSDLLAALNKIAGDVTDIRVRQVGGYLVTELAHKMANGRIEWAELAQESDGTLRTLGLLVALYQVGPPSPVVIEEPELSLHPGALGVISDVLREASTRNQILITTQSPDLISRFGADELRVVERVNGATEIGPVDETQRQVINEQLFSAGDLLRIEGLHRAPVEAAGGGHA